MIITCLLLSDVEDNDNYNLFIYIKANHRNFSKQGNSVARDLPPTGLEANTTIVVFLYILDIDSHCPYLLLIFKTKIYIVFYSQNYFF